MDCNSQAMTNVNIDSGNIDGTTIATSDITVGAGKTLNVSGGTFTTDNLTVTGDTATFTSANSDDPLVEIKNTNNDANGARLRLTKDKGAAGAANDVNGLIEFYGDDANQEQVKFSEIKSQVKVATDGEEGGKFTISVAEHDGTSTAGLVIEDGDADGELDVTIAAGASSLTTVAGDLTVNGTVNGNVDVSAGTLTTSAAQNLAIIQGAGSNIDIGAFDLEAQTITVGGTSGVSISQGAISIKNGGTQSYVDFYCESANAHYARLQAPAHADFGGNIILTLPATTDTLLGKATTDTLTNKTLTEPKIANEGFIADANGAEQIIFTTTASAVNEFTIANAISGNSPSITATGDDSDIGINLTPKGIGAVAITSTTPSTSTTTGALTVAGGAAVADDLFIGDNLRLISDDAVLSFGDNSEITLTHVHNTGLLLTDSGGNGNPTLQLHDSAESVSSDGDKLILTSNSVAFSMPTADGTSGQQLTTDGLGTLSWADAGGGGGTTINNNADNRIITGSGTADTLEAEANLTFDGSTFNIQSSSNGAPTLVIKNTTNDTDSGGMIFTKDKGAAGADGDDLGFILFKGGDAEQTQTDFAKIIGEVSSAIDTDEAGKLSLQVAADGLLTTGLLLEGDRTSGEVDVAIGTGISSLTTVAGDMKINGTDLSLFSDSSILNFGADSEIKLTHVHDTGLLLTDSGGNGNPTLQLHDSAESVSSDGDKLILTSNSVAFSMPTADGTNGQQLTTNGSGTLSWADAGGGGGSTTINNNADNRIITGSGTADTLEAEADLTFDGSTFNIQSSSSEAPTLVIKNTTNDANSGGMIFTKDKGATGAAGDDLGFILFKGGDAAEMQTDFAKIIGEVSTATDTDEAGKLSLQVAASDGTTTALVTGLLLEGEEATSGEVDVTIGAGTSSLTTLAGRFKITPTVMNADYTVSSSQVTIDFSVIGDIIITLKTDNVNFSLVATNVSNIGQQGSIIIINSASNVPIVNWDTSKWYFESGFSIPPSNAEDEISIFSYYIVATDKVLITGSTSFSENSL